MPPIISRRKDRHVPALTWILRTGIIAAFGLVTLILLAACNRPKKTTEPAKPQNPPSVRTEQLWIVESIVHDIADMAVYASDRKVAPLPADALRVDSQPSDARGYHYNVTLHLPGESKPFQWPVDISGAIWAPANYQPFAYALLEKLKLTGTSDSTAINENPIGSLIYPLAENIQRENERVSSLLTEHPLAPEPHEQAAMIVGLLGLRENSGVLWDTRGMCNRAAAHLALAKAIRGNQAMSDSGEIGELLIGLLDDTKKDCEQRIAKLKDRAQTKRELDPWIVAAQLRNRRDWRILDQPKTASLLERLEYFRARCESVSPDAASEDLVGESPENIPDWSCIILQFDFSVGDGHTFAESGLRREFQEISQIFPVIRARKLTAETLAGTLNEAPAGAVQRDASGNVRLLPIDDGMWAHFFQRHLCHIASRTDYFFRDCWAFPERAAKFESDIGTLFRKLTFVPLMRVMWNSSRHPDRGGDAQAIELITQHPEWVPAVPWDMIPRGTSTTLPAIGAWFSPGLPTGTAYSFYGRDRHISKVRLMSADNLRKLYEIAPWHYGVADHYLRALYGENPTPDQFRSIAGYFLDFNVSAMRAYASHVKDDLNEYVSVHQRIAKFDPYDYITLSRYYREHEMDAAAAEAIQAALDNNADPVAVTHASGWLVNYYFDHGQKDRALEIAKDAAEIYSCPGLYTMAELQERMGNPQEAESYFEKIKERYNDATPLTAFYQRQETLHPNSPYAAKLKSSIESIFPGGMKSVTLADFAEPPKKGVIISNHNDRLLKCGLKKGDIIVALDGKQTQDLPQYNFVRELTRSPHMEFIVFQAGKYQLVKAEVPDRRFGVDFRSWQ